MRGACLLEFSWKSKRFPGMEFKKYRRDVPNMIDMTAHSSLILISVWRENYIYYIDLYVNDIFIDRSIKERTSFVVRLYVIIAIHLGGIQPGL